MSSFSVPRAWRGRGVAVLAATALAAGAIAAVPLFRGESAPTVVAAAPASGPVAQTARSLAEVAAQAQAKATGTPVSIAADTTATSTTVANPNGSFTFTGEAAPTRVKRGERWVSVDATLHAATDGTLAPAATASAVTLSGGGSTPLASFDDGAGHRLSLSLPMALPKPAVSGDTATYTGILPGVDLAVTTTIYGGIREVVIVHDAKAAANPALAQLRFTTTSTGLSLGTGADGNIVAADRVTGAAVFEAPQPVMWDSAAPAGARPGDRSPAGDLLVSTLTGPGAGAHRAIVPDSATDGVITLSPPAAALTGPGIVYPVFIDPPMTPAPTYNYEAYVESNHPTLSDFNPGDDLKVGYDDWTSGCEPQTCYVNKITRSYLHYDGIGVLAGKYIESAHLNVHQIRTSCASNTVDTVNVAITNQQKNFGSTTNWNNQPLWSSVQGTGTVNRQTNQQFQLDVRAIIDYGPGTHGYQTLPLVMWLPNETDHCMYRHFTLQPNIDVTYWSTPNVPASLAVQNGGSSLPCNTTSPGNWVSAASGNQVTLKDTVSTPDASTAMTANYYVSENGGTAVNYHPGATETTANTQIPTSQAITLNSGSSYAWYANTANQFRTSANTSTCYFRYDATPPSAPVASSTAYPVAGPTTVTGTGSGTISWTASDASSGIASYNYNLNGASLTASGEANITSPSLSVALSTLHWGTNTLWLQSVDAVGNVSTPVAYSFYVQQSAFGTYTTGTAGDLTGDNQPDLVTVDAAGAVHLFSSPDTTTVNPTGDLTADPNQYGGRVIIPATSNARWPIPDSASAAGAIVAHGGSFTGNNYDDLVVEQNGHLGVAINPGTTANWSFTTTNVAKPACAGCANYNATGWSSVTQMIAMPTGVAARPDLITVEVVNGLATLWLYTPVVGSYAYNAPTAISTYTSAWHWEDMQLVGAGPLRGSTGTTLWVREIDGGNLDLFHNIEAGIPTPATSFIRVGSGLSMAAAPLLTTIGRADANGNLPLWATDATGHLTVIPTTTTTAGVTTVGTVAAISAAGWANHELALGGSYQLLTNAGIGADGQASAAFDSGAFMLSSNALGNATVDGSTVINNGNPCPAGWTSCDPVLDGGTKVSVPRAAGLFNHFYLSLAWTRRHSNYQATGQVLPAPTPNTDGPARTISFLGAATNAGASGASVSATITYTNGHTQSITITLTDWAQAPVATNTVVATMDHRLKTVDGSVDATPTYLFETQDVTLLDNGNPLGTNVQIASIALGNNPSIHIFSTAVAA